MNQGRSKEQYRTSAIGAFVSLVGIGIILLGLIISNLLQ
tara:strand:- start:402 stop:518 length:117 start_codon:yes stop_codon:yes gene_type:complete